MGKVVRKWMSEIRVQCFSVLVGLCCASCGRHCESEREAWFEIVTYTEESHQTSRLQGKRPTYLKTQSLSQKANIWTKKDPFTLAIFSPEILMRLLRFLKLKQTGVTEDDCSGLPFIVAFLKFMYFIIVNIHEICLSLSLFHCVYIYLNISYSWNTYEYS